MKKEHRLFFALFSLILLLSFSFAFASASSGKCDTIFCWLINLFSGKSLTGQTVLTDTSGCPNGLIAYWDFDEGSGATAYDAFNVRNAAISGTPIWETGSNAKVGSALRFDGSGDMALVSTMTPSNSNISDQMTVVAWAKITGSNPNGLNMLADFDDYYAGGYPLMLGYTGSIIAQIQNSAGTYASADSDSPASTYFNSWHHYAGVYDGSKVKLYIDGVLQTDQPSLSGNVRPNAGSGFGMGNLGHNTDYNMLGTLDEVAIFNKALTQTEVQQVMQKGADGKGVCYAAAPPALPVCGTSDTAGMVSYYPFDDGTAKDVKDGNNGIINGATQTAGKVGQGFSFDGLNDYIDLGDAGFDWVDKNVPFTFVTWVRFGSVAGQQSLISKYSPTTGGGWFIEPTNGNNMYFYFLSGNWNNGYTQNSNNNYAFVINNWTHVAITYDGSVPENLTAYKYYINSVEQGAWSNNGWSLPVASVVNNGQTFLGSRTGTTQMLNGILDEVAIYNRSLTASEVQALYSRSAANQSYCNVSVAAPPAPTCPAGMVSYWKGDIDGRDEKGVNNGVLKNGASITSQGKVGAGAFLFDGVNDNLEVADSASLNFVNAMSVEAWVKKTGSTATRFMLEKGPWVSSYAFAFGSNMNPAFGLKKSGETMQFVYSSPDGSPNLLPLNQWAHIVGTFDGTTMKIYVNGKLMNSIQRQEGISTFAGALNIGGGPWDDWGLDGILDEVAIYNRSLTDGGCTVGQQCGGEVGDHYNNGQGKDYCAAAPSGCTATGGTETTVGNYKIHTFTSNGTLTVTSGCNAEVLVVAGGGGAASGAGGAGGLIHSSSYAISGNIPVTIGAGGAGVTSAAPGIPGNNGGNSIFGSLTAIGGGGGGSINNDNAQNGGSGGGGGRTSDVTSHPGGNGVTGQGFKGGSDLNVAPYPSGGGGGAGEAGKDATTVSGNGGNGLQYDITGTLTYYAGGGGGGGSAISSCPKGNGGLGGGGDGSYAGAGNSGIANTGGGGGGAETSFLGGSGGSGIVIVRYLLSGAPACTDADHDGYNTTAGGTCGTVADCDDSNNQIYPGAPENTNALCNDEIDNDCDSMTDFPADTDSCLIGVGGLESCDIIDVNGDGQINVLDVIILSDMAAGFSWQKTGNAGCEAIYAEILGQ